MFAGANYHVEEVMLNTMSMFAGQHGATVLTSGSIKGILSGQPKVLPDSAKLARPKGTILSFKFPVSQGKWHIKTFLFE
jgi:hypothetical protein